MSDHQLQPFEKIDTSDAKSRLEIFEEAVLKHKGKVSG